MLPLSTPSTVLLALRNCANLEALNNDMIEQALFLKETSVSGKSAPASVASDAQLPARSDVASKSIVRGELVHYMRATIAARGMYTHQLPCPPATAGGGCKGRRH